MKKDILDSWERNADEWIKAIDNKAIASRKVTNTAIVERLMGLAANSVVDIGCGEGWLTRKITAMGKKAVGTDATAALLKNAEQKGPESYYRMEYDDIAKGEKIPEGPFDAAVFNFSIYQKENLSTLLHSTKQNLTKDGTIIIQTLHPLFLLNTGLEYKSQMVSDSWKGLPGNFVDGHEWYARTFSNWVKVITAAELDIQSISEPSNAEKQPVSLILTFHEYYGHKRRCFEAANGKQVLFKSDERR